MKGRIVTAGLSSVTRHKLVLAVSALVAVSVAVYVPTPAAAATADDLTSLRAALDGCSGTAETPLEITLTSSIDAPTEEIIVPCVVELNVADRALAIRRVVIESGDRLEVRSEPSGTGTVTVRSTVTGEAAISMETATFVLESGSVEATGRTGGAALGGDSGASGGSVIVRGGTLTAQGGTGAAGIGSGLRGGGGNGYTQSGGIVSVRGGQLAAGIGGGYEAVGSTMFISGGELEVVGGGDESAAIGNGGGVPFLPFSIPGPITIDGGIVSASTGGTGAAIGGSQRHFAPTIAITGGTVTAESSLGWGIGGIDADIEISGGTVVATSRDRGAGIGGPGARLNVLGGSVTATSVNNGVGIGNDNSTGGIEITVADGAVVTAAGYFGPLGATTFSSVFGDVQIDGDLYLPPGGELWIPAGVDLDVGATGRVLGSIDDPTTGARITGEGVINNAGIVAHRAELVDVDVLQHNYLVTYDRIGDGAHPTQRVFAPELDQGFRAVIDARPGTDWNLQPDGSGSPFTSTTPLQGDVTVFEVARDLVLSIDPANGTTAAGDTVTFSTAIVDSDANPVVGGPVIELTSSAATDTVSGQSVTVRTAGSRTITARAVLDGVVLESATATLAVVPGPVASLTLNAPRTTVRQGESITFEVSALDAFDNPVTLSDVVLSSSVATDVVTGLTVRFPTASPHVITATSGSVSTNLVITVLSPTSSLGSTGIPDDLSLVALIAIVSILLGIVASRRRNELRP